MERAQIFEPERVRACQNKPRACFEPELLTNKKAKNRVLPYFEHFGILGLLSLELGAYLLRAQISARASEPEPRLVPPLVRSFLSRKKFHQMISTGSSKGKV